MASQEFIDDFLKQEVRSESTLPLLNFLLSTKPGQTDEAVAKSLHEVTAGIGKQDPPMPDESEQDKEALLKLMKDGPGKVTGNPTVSPDCITHGFCIEYF